MILPTYVKLLGFGSDETYPWISAPHPSSPHCQHSNLFSPCTPHLPAAFTTSQRLSQLLKDPAGSEKAGRSPSAVGSSEHSLLQHEECDSASVN